MCRVEPDAIDEGGTPRVVPVHPGKYSPRTRSRPPVPWDPAHLIRRPAPWKTLADVELATAEYVDWFNTRRLHTAIGGIPPAEHEAAYYAQTQPQPQPEAGPNN